MNPIRHKPSFGSVANAPASRIRFILLNLLCGLSAAAIVLGLQPLQAKDTNEVKQEETVKKKVFNFEGGNPLEFIVALDRHFRTRLVQILTLPEILSKTKVPKLRVAADDPREVLTVYNKLQSPTLGQWHYEPEGTTPAPSAGNTNVNMNALMLVPDKALVANKLDRNVMRVKGLALAGVPESKWDVLQGDIESARAYGEKAATNGVSDLLEGSVRFQRESKILIAAGSEGYIQMVESLVSAHRANAEFETKAATAPSIPSVEGVRK